VVLLLVSTSMAFAWILAWTGAPAALAAALIGLGGGKLGFLLLLNVVLLILGTFLDMTPAILLITPVVLPAATALGIDPIHLGIVMVVNLCVGLCTPPVGSVLFVGCSVSGATVGEVVPPLVRYWIAMIVALLLISWLPWFSLWWR
jgi:tripartite ATP-independent transporter DctM subunit